MKLEKQNINKMNYKETETIRKQQQQLTLEMQITVTEEFNRELQRKT